MNSNTVMTVRGPVSVDELGFTLMHEHILVNMLRELRLEGLLNDVPLAVKELTLFQELGGRTIVDVTNTSIGQSPVALRDISEASGVNIVLGCGLYRHQYYDSGWVDRISTDQLADWIVRDLTEGIGDTGVRAGVIGEIACDEWMTAQEERVFRAAARAQKTTGVTVTTHAARWPVGNLQLDLFEEEGVDLRRVVIGHCDTVSSNDWRSIGEVTEYHEGIARRGAFVQFDTIRKGNQFDLETRVDFVMNMVDKGFIRQVLLSQDVAWKSALRTYGGGGYTFIQEDFIPRLAKAGLTEEQIAQITVENPKRALTGVEI